MIGRNIIEEGGSIGEISSPHRLVATLETAEEPPALGGWHDKLRSARSAFEEPNDCSAIEIDPLAPEGRQPGVEPKQKLGAAVVKCLIEPCMLRFRQAGNR